MLSKDEKNCDKQDVLGIYRLIILRKTHANSGVRQSFGVKQNFTRNLLQSNHVAQ